jgi:hypothetical protein
MTPNLVSLLSIAISTDMLKHTHTCTCFCNMFTAHTSKTKRDSVEPNGARSRIIAMIFQVDNHLSTSHYVTIHKTIHMYYLNKSHKVHMDNLMNYHVISCSKMAINSCSQTISIYKIVYGLKGNKKLQLCG